MTKEQQQGWLRWIIGVFGVAGIGALISLGATLSTVRSAVGCAEEAKSSSIDNQRSIAVLQAQGIENARRMERVESKIDKLLERPR